MRSNRLQLNTANTEVVWSTLHPVDASICYQCHPSEWVPTKSCQFPLSATSASTWTLMCQWGHTFQRLHVAACFAILRQLQNIRRSVPRSVLQSLVSSLVLQRLYYGNETLAGISDTIIDLVIIIIITQRHVKHEFLIDYFDRSKIHKTESNPPIQYQKLENS